MQPREETEIEREVERLIAALNQVPGKAAAITDDDRKHVLEQLAAKSWDDMGILEGNNQELLIPWKLWRRTKKGDFEGKPVALRVPDGPVLRRARVESREYAVKEGRLDLDRDKDLVEDLESLWILWLSIREPTAPFEPIAMDAKDLEKVFGRANLEQINFALEHAKRILSPKVSGMSADELSALTAAIVARQSILPLAAFDDATQASFVITMARLHQAFLIARSSPGPSERSTPA